MNRYRERPFSYSAFIPNSRLETDVKDFYDDEAEARNGESIFSREPNPNLIPQESSFKDTMNDVITPGFTNLVTKGLALPVNGMSSVRYSGDCKYIIAVTLDRKVDTYSVGTRKLYRRTDWKRTSVYVAPIPGGSASLPGNTEIRLVNAAGARMQSGFMDVLTTASEIHKTYELVRGFRRRIIKQLTSFGEKAARLVRQFQSRYGGTKVHAKIVAKELAKMSSAFWLEWRYGWRLLYYDYNSVINIAKKASSEGFVRKRFYETDSASNDSVSTRNDGVAEVTVTYRRSIKARAMVMGRVNMSYPVKVDPISTLWEIIPLSFVIDMFWNVGDVLSGFSPFRRASSEAASYSTLEEISSDINIALNPPSEGWTRLHSGQKTTGSGLVITRKTRKRSDQKFSFSSKIDLPWDKGADILALAIALSKSLTKLGKALLFMKPPRR